MNATINTRRVIIERHKGWETASPALLARVFETTPQRITTICRERCAVCGLAICGHSDHAWGGASLPTSDQQQAAA